MRKRSLSVAGAVLCLVLMIVGITACGGGSSSTTNTGTAATEGGSNATESSGSENAGYEEAKASYEKYLEEPDPIKLPPLKEKPPTGKSLAIVGCPIPACATTTGAVEEAAKALGWKPKTYVSQFTPESFQKTWEQMLQANPDYIVGIGVLPNATVESQMAEAEAREIPVVMISPNGDKPGANGVIAQVNGQPLFAKGGEIAADLIVADAAGNPTQVGIVSDPNQQQLGQAIEPLEKRLEATCPECKGETVDINLSNPSEQNAQAVVAYVRTHPEVEYLFYTVADAALGLPEALAAAGLSNVKVITLTPNLTSLENVKKGTEFATIQDESAAGGWRAIDALARNSVGEGVGPEWNPTGEFRILILENVEPGKVPDSCCIPNSFTEAWLGKP